MEFDELVVKESPGLCRCCLSEGCYKDLGSEYTWMSETEVYADMLLECFDISITQHTEGPNGPSRLICEVCITRLRDACNFKKQVLDSEKKFVDMVGRGEFGQKVMIYQTSMRLEGDGTEAGEVEYLDDDMHFDDADDEPLRPPTESTQAVPEPSASDEIIISTLKVKGKRGRPRKVVTDKVEKKPKLSRTEDKPMTSKAVKAVKGERGQTRQRNALLKRNAITILENSTATPFIWQLQSYHCFYCRQIFNDATLLKTHTLTHDRETIEPAISNSKWYGNFKIDVTNLTCKICNESIENDNVNNLVKHLSTHSINLVDKDIGVLPYKLGKDRFECAFCVKHFIYFQNLNEHMNEHFGTYVCEVCGKSFLRLTRLKSHGLTHNSYHCRYCIDTFSTLSHKLRHESSKHNKVPEYKCSYCPETFQNYNMRKQHHILSHAENSGHNCEFCNKPFISHSRMYRHVREVHLKERSITCSVCHKTFFLKSGLRKHMRKHFEEKFKCDICNKVYSRAETLKYHMRTHNENKIMCPVCGKNYENNNNLEHHLKKYHPGISVKKEIGGK